MAHQVSCLDTAIAQSPSKLLAHRMPKDGGSNCGRDGVRPGTRFALHHIHHEYHVADIRITRERYRRCDRWGYVDAGCIVGLVIVLLGAVTGGAISFEWPMVRIDVTGPFVEEWFFRGVLAFVRLAGVSFWPTAIMSGVLFGMVHVQWTGDGFAQGWPHGLLTTAGGIWFAWLAREWGCNFMGRHRRAWPHEPGLAVVRHRQRDLARDRTRHHDRARHRHDDSSSLAAYELGAGVWSVGWPTRKPNPAR